MRDEVFALTTRIERPAAEVFAWHERPGAFERLVPPWERVELVSSSGGIRDGAKVVVRSKVGPFWSVWHVVHRDYVAGRQFRDVLERGPFAKWEHLHRIEPDGPGACRLTDEITFRLPLGAPGRAVAGGFTRRKLERLFAWRHATTKADLEWVTPAEGAGLKRVAIAGASGLIGRRLANFLETQGHTVVRLVRHAARGPKEVHWAPAAGEIDAGALEGADAIVNLSGENVGAGRWTAARREAILRSRVDATRALVRAVQQLQRKPAVFVSASAVGFYGERGDEVLTEASGIGQGFLPEVCLAWETHAEGAARAGVRTVRLRFGVVLTPAGGALAKLLPVFRVGVGGRMGNGRQWMSWIALDDAVGAIAHAIATPGCDGPINVTAPEPVTNAAFTSVLAEVLGRPAFCAVPAGLLRAIFGQMARETILASGRAVPQRLQETGYVFRAPSLQAALAQLLGR